MIQIMLSETTKHHKTYLSSTLFLLLIHLIIIIIIPVFPLSPLVFFPHLYVALGRRWQHCGWQHRGRWTGTRRHGGHDLGCDGGHWWSRRLGWRHHRPAILGHHFVMTWKEPLLDWVVLGFWRLGCERLNWMGQGASGRGVCIYIIVCEDAGCLYTGQRATLMEEETESDLLTCK